MTNRINNLNTDIWLKKEYYQKISQKEDFSHPGFLYAVNSSKKASSILDIGSGDGSKLARLGNLRTLKVGCDPSFTGSKIAKQANSKMLTVVCEGEYLPFVNNSFQQVTCFFVLEHTHNPEELVKEIIRVTKKEGLFIIVAPNFGAPNRASPNYKKSRISKLLNGLKFDLFINASSLNWNSVKPNLKSINEFEPDLDTTIEPYLLSLTRFIRQFPVKIIHKDSCWEMELEKPKLLQKIFRFLGTKSVFPFSYWGPHLFLVGKKQ